MMTQKLFCMVKGKTSIEGMDAVMMQELLLGGHLYLQVLKEKLQGWLVGVKLTMLKKDLSSSGSLSPDEMNVILRKAGTIEAPLEHFLNTGNITSSSGLALLQIELISISSDAAVLLITSTTWSGYHSREHQSNAVHVPLPCCSPGLLLQQYAWGFICPVHTPDGSPCGLLNHLTKDCIVGPVSEFLRARMLSADPSAVIRSANPSAVIS